MWCAPFVPFGRPTSNGVDAGSVRLTLQPRGTATIENGGDQEHSSEVMTYAARSRAAVTTWWGVDSHLTFVKYFCCLFW